MLGWSELISAAGQDPLVIVLGLALIGTIAAQLLARKYPLVRAGIRFVFLVLLTIVFVRAGIVAYRAQPSTGDAFLDLVHRVLKIVWWLWAAWFVAGLLRALVIVERLPHETRLIQDLLAGIIYLTAFFAIAACVLGLPVQGLLATSGVLAIILGLSLQSQLGRSLLRRAQFQPAYVSGDWVDFEGTAAGRVIEMNWRATHVLTERRDLTINPNSTISKSRITNVSLPSTIHGVTATVQLDPGTQPAICGETIEHAILNCRSISTTPSPSVAVKTITGSFTEFEMTFFVEGVAQAAAARNELFDLISDGTGRSLWRDEHAERRGDTGAARRSRPGGDLRADQGPTRAHSRSPAGSHPRGVARAGASHRPNPTRRRLGSGRENSGTPAERVVSDRLHRLFNMTSIDHHD